MEGLCFSVGFYLIPICERFLGFLFSVFECNG
jgi:hypothetical protein